MPRTIVICRSLCIAAWLTGNAAARAAEPPPAAFSWLDEMTIGVMAHDPTRVQERGSLDARFEALTSPIARAASDASPFAALLAPRLALGATLNSAGKTDFAYLGPAWRFDLVGPLFLDGEFGLALNNYRPRADGLYLNLGSHVTFHEEIGLGLRLSERWDVIATAEHISHAALFAHANAGLTDVGVRLGYRF